MHELSKHLVEELNVDTVIIDVSFSYHFHVQFRKSLFLNLICLVGASSEHSFQVSFFDTVLIHIGLKHGKAYKLG